MFMGLSYGVVTAYYCGQYQFVDNKVIGRALWKLPDFGGDDDVVISVILVQSLMVEFLLFTPRGYQQILCLNFLLDNSCQ